MKVVDFGHELKYGVIPGVNEFIVTQSDFVHFTHPNDEPLELLVGYDKTEGVPDEQGWTPINIKEINQTVTLAELLARAVEMELKDFGHYWGIKQRVAYNFHLLKGTMEAIGADTSDMPEWGK